MLQEITFGIVLFTLLVRGVTIEPLVQRWLRSEKEPTGDPPKIRSAYPASPSCWWPSWAMMRVAMRSSMTESGSRISPRTVRTPTRPA